MVDLLKKLGSNGVFATGLAEVAEEEAEEHNL